MISRTKKILILSISLVLLSLAACLFLVYKISHQGSQLKEFVNILNEQNAHEESFIRINRLVQETEAKRLAVTAAFFQDESDSIAFLGDIESFARTINLELETADLNKITNETTKNEYITMTFKYAGTERMITEFTELLENIPYHAKVNSLSLRQVSNGLWEGEATLFITIKKSWPKKKLLNN